MGAQRARYLAFGFIVAIVLSIAADRVSAVRGDGLAAAADLKGWPAAPLAVTLPTGPLSFIAVTPCRVADTRGNGFGGQYGPPSIGGGGVRTFTIGGQCGIPAAAAAVSFNFTILDMSTNGDIRVFPAGGAAPLVSTQNWTPSTGVIANAAATPLGTGNAVSVQIDGLGAVNLIIDVNGYYEPIPAAATPLNPLQVATLRWYEASQVGDFAVGTNPFAVAFDGASVWVANRGSNNVAKLRASDGLVLGTFAVGTWPEGVAFDGASIWVANGGSANVTKLRASDGALLGTFAVGAGPAGVAFDGANVWVANFNSVTKLRASDGATLGSFAVGSGPRGVVFDGANVWVANQSSNNVTKLRASDGAVLGTFAVVNQPVALAFDGANVWVASQASDDVTKLRASDGFLLGAFVVGYGPFGVVFDGSSIWTANRYGNNVTKLRASDGLVLGTFAVGTQPIGIAFDGANVWVTNNGSGTVSKR
jgi:hypothetical protein